MPLVITMNTWLPPRKAPRQSRSQATIEAHRVDADLHRVLEQKLGDMDRDAHHDEYLGVMEDRIGALLARHRDEITAPDLKLAAFMLMHAAHGLIHAAVLKRPEGVSLKHATQEIVSMTTAYLTSPRTQ